jgi:outer membrane protein
MKKVLGALFILVFLSTHVFAFGASTIGYIDVQKVFNEFKETEKAQEKLAKEEEKFKKDFEESQKELQSAEKEGKSKDELEKIKADLEKKLEPQRKALLKLNEELTLGLQKKIVEAVTTVSKKVGLDVVVDKQVIVVGGTDLSDMVLKELNK